MANAVKILDIKVGDKVYDGRFGKYQRVSYLVQELSTKKEHKVSGFLNEGNAVPCTVGDEVQMQIEKNGQYLNCKGIEPLEEPETIPDVPAAEAEEGKVDWDGKERRMVRMNSWQHAVRIVKLSLESKQEKETLGESTIYHLCQTVAHLIESDVYGPEAIDDSTNTVEPF